MSVPYWTTSAFSNYNVKSPVGTLSYALRYKAFGSKNITGLGSLIEASNKPLAWIGSLGTTTFKPGVWAK